MAGSILLHAQKPPRKKQSQKISLCSHEALRGAISVVIPCRNEEMNVGPLIARILDLYGEYIHEIIPVDDGSTDRTREVIAALATKDARIKPIYRSPPKGVGRAMADGLRATTGRYSTPAWIATSSIFCRSFVTFSMVPPKVTTW